MIDGRLDDAVWREAAHVTALVQRRPFDGIPASEPSDIYLAYDSSNIYFGLHAHYSVPGMIRANRRDRDQSIDDDLFLIYFDPFLDQQVRSHRGRHVQTPTSHRSNQTCRRSRSTSALRSSTRNCVRFSWKAPRSSTCGRRLRQSTPAESWIPPTGPN